MSEAKFENTQRVLNLTFAILASGRNGLTKDQIFRSVPGYEGFKAGDDADDRLFSRDKDTLRKTGIRLVEQDISSLGSGEEYRYCISQDSFRWPKGFFPTAEQTRLLELAANCWRDESVAANLDSALERLISLGEAPNRAALTELVPSFRPLDSSFGPLTKAIDDQRVVTLKYRKPNNEVETRTFAPWRFLNVEGEWLVQGWCYTRHAVRNFLLKRIVDKKIAPLADKKVSYKPATPADILSADQDLAEFRSNKVAKISVQPNTAAWSHFEMDFEQGQVKVIRFMDEELLAIQLRRYAGQLEVLEPQNLAEEIKSGLEKVVAKHA